MQTKGGRAGSVLSCGWRRLCCYWSKHTSLTPFSYVIYFRGWRGGAGAERTLFISGGKGNNDNNYTQCKTKTTKSEVEPGVCSFLPRPSYLYTYHMTVGSGSVSLRPMPRAHTFRTHPCRKAQGRESCTLVAQHPPKVLGPGLTL